ncbi:MAG: BREX system P-loop protein BrxC [Spiribacter salinus]|uniref:BREX system P-loop protein BrxC n=1 Tax=Spiribacter salinus TaxID=1335746 RepID=A0A540VPZ2_9GAMM|nr:MAG: BREX system P-loop protein BrxC [Spiribacter salinus]
MSLKAIFKKPVDRPIEGVIKADDSESLRLEVEEYVLTNEVQKRLEQFLDAYNDYKGANGVWLSGFFGSGKSHLLKMLALVLEDHEIDGFSTLEAFLEKCDDNEMLRGALKTAARVPSQSILFNIDQKADVISKTQVDALLSVFMKVFDESCGYYGKQGYIAQFERDLDRRDQFGRFRQAFEQAAGISWEEGREQALLESDNIATAYAEATGKDADSARGILDKYRQDYKVSIEDFADLVREHIERQGDDFRLNFFVDEAGQYIAYDTKLMTNLQTIAESLATKCRGRSWIVVTAQEEMDSVLGQIKLPEGDDFTKIQDRFKNRLKLTSTNVSEVIQRRLLKKKEDAVPAVSKLYEQHSGNLKTLLGFTDGSATYRNFRDGEHFVDCYPFIPYQFDLFQSVIQNLSAHNAFEGKHSSVGERSMLAVFQQVAREIEHHEIGQLATFDLMFEGIRTALKASFQASITRAERNLDDEFAVRLLKALFLVKYVREFKSTVHNLSVLMLESFDQNVGQLKKQVEGALSKLEQQTYIQRTGEQYEYLTREEKDVEQAIKNTDVDTADAMAELERLAFDRALRLQKIGHPDYKHEYKYSRKVDERLYGREQELAIHLITPLHEHAGNPENLYSWSALNESELLVVLPDDDRLLHDLLMVKKTEKYTRQNINATQNEDVRRILTEKSMQNQQRMKNLEARVGQLLGKAKLLVAGKEVELATEDAQTRIVQGFHQLLDRNYPNLRMLRGFNYTEADIGPTLRDSKNSLLTGEAEGTLPEPEQEMLAFINSNKRAGVKTTVSTLLEKFQSKPYGWYYAAVLVVLARLCARGKADLRADGNLLEGDELEKAISNTQRHGNVVVDPQAAFSASQVRALKDFFGEFLNKPAGSREAKALAYEISDEIQELRQRLEKLLAQADQYPFLEALRPVVDKLAGMKNKPYDWFLQELPNYEDELLELKEEVIDPIQSFMAGGQKEIYLEARNFLREQKDNFAYLDAAPGQDWQANDNPDYAESAADRPAALAETLSAPDCFRGNKMQQVRQSIERLGERLRLRLQHERQAARERIQRLQTRAESTDEFARLDQDDQKRIRSEFEEASNGLESLSSIPVIRDRLNRFQDDQYPRLLAEITSLASPPESAEGDAAAPGGTTEPPTPQVEYVPMQTLMVDADRPWLASTEDVEEYLAELRRKMLEAIRQGKRLQL